MRILQLLKSFSIRGGSENSKIFMSILKKLKIKGIRSFHPLEHEEIEFDAPVTLITGSNGSGKTSIIETLSYLTTDKQTNKKSDFIHDPRIWNEKFTDSEAILRFTSWDGFEKEIIRKARASLKKPQVSSKKTQNTAIKFENIENSVLSYNDNGGVISKSYKSEEIKNEIPHLFGVSEVILKYVIFCHQNDSLWPFDLKDSDLKERFDQIFGLEKYDKSIDYIKEIIKENKKSREKVLSEIKELESKEKDRLKYKEAHQNEIKSINELQDQVNNITKELEKDEADISLLKNNKKKIDNYNNQINIINQQIIDKNFEIKKIEKETGSNHSSESQCFKEKNHIETQIKSIKETFDLISNQIISKENESKNLLETKNELNHTIENLNNSYSEYQATTNIYLKNIENVKKEFLTDNIEKLKIDFQTEKKNLQKDLYELEKNKSELHSIKSKKIQEKSVIIQNLERSLSIDHNNLSRLNFELGNLKEITENEKESLNQKFIQKEKEYDEFNKSSLSPQFIQSEKKKQEEFFFEINKSLKEIENTMKQSEKQQKTEEDILFSKANIIQNERKIKDSLEKISNLTNMPNLNIESLSFDINSLISENTKSIQDLESNLSSLLQSIGMKAQSIETNKNNILKNEKIIIEIQSKVYKIIKEESFDDLYNESITKLDYYSKKLARYQKMSDIYKLFEQKSKEPDCKCPLCQRKFNDENERDNFIEQEIHQILNSLPKKIEKKTSLITHLKIKKEELELIKEDIKLLNKLKSDNLQLNLLVLENEKDLKSFIYKKEDSLIIKNDLNLLKNQYNLALVEYNKFKEINEKNLLEEKQLQYLLLERKDNIPLKSDLIKHLEEKEQMKDQIQQKIIDLTTNLSISKDKERDFEKLVNDLRFEISSFDSKFVKKREIIL